jgi:hypothetical protein
MQTLSDGQRNAPRRMANFMARYRGGDGHYADVECAYAELKRYLVLVATNKPATGKKKATKPGGLSLSRSEGTQPRLVCERRGA